MIVKSINNSNRLFQIGNIFPESLVQEILTLPWENMTRHPGELYEHPSRRRVYATQYNALEIASKYIQDCLCNIEEFCKIIFINRCPTTVWWYDEPHFDSILHTDGHLPSAMQLFWIAPSEDFATQFYNFKNVNTIISDLKFTPNSGYLMLNMPNKDGSQPLQWHGMLNKVPKNTHRITSYTTFGTYENK